jgi:hypothetical protein
MIWYALIASFIALYFLKNPLIAFAVFAIVYWLTLWYDPTRKYIIVSQEIFDKPIIFEGVYNGRSYVRTLFNPKLIKGANMEQLRILMKNDYLKDSVGEALKKIYPNGEKDLENAKFDFIIGVNKYSATMPLVALVVFPPDDTKSTTDYFYSTYSFITFSSVHKLHASAMFPVSVIAKEKGWKPVQNVIVCVPSSIKYREDFSERVEKLSALGRIESVFYTAVKDALANAELAKTLYSSIYNIKRYDEMVLSKLSEASTMLGLLKLELEGSIPMTEDEILSRYVIKGKKIAPKVPSPVYLLIVFGAVIGSIVADRFGYPSYIGAFFGGVLGYILTMVDWSAIFEKAKAGVKKS